MSYIEPSLKPFRIKNVKFVNKTVRCKKLLIPTHTALSGNYNETIINELRTLFTDFYKNTQKKQTNDKVYISRGKAHCRKIINENECIAVLEKFGFKTIFFEDHSFENQVKIASNAKYLIPNHGAGLTNMLFLQPGSNILELRKKGDSHNNCYFSLASTLDLNYFYQICDSMNPDENALTADLIVDCQLLQRNIDHMLSISN